jgi:hypothetical protein
MKTTISYEVTIKGTSSTVFDNYPAAWNYAYDHQNELTKFEIVEKKCFGLITKRTKLKNVI